MRYQHGWTENKFSTPYHIIRDSGMVWTYRCDNTTPIHNMAQSCSGLHHIRMYYHFTRCPIKALYDLLNRGRTETGLWHGWQNSGFIEPLFSLVEFNSFCESLFTVILDPVSLVILGVRGQIQQLQSILIRDGTHSNWRSRQHSGVSRDSVPLSPSYLASTKWRDFDINIGGSDNGFDEAYADRVGTDLKPGCVILDCTNFLCYFQSWNKIDRFLSRPLALIVLSSNITLLYNGETIGKWGIWKRTLLLIITLNLPRMGQIERNEMRKPDQDWSIYSC